MSLIISENFDSVVAPALPATVSQSALAGSSAVTSTSFSLSSPNSVLLSGPSGQSVSLLSNSSDNSSGNCTVTGYIVFQGTFGSNDQNGGLEISIGSKSYPSQAASNSYAFGVLNAGTIGFAIWKTTNGSFAYQIGNTGATSFSVGTRYYFSLTRNGNTLWCACQRQDTMQWAAPAGGWQTSYAAVIVWTDSTPLSHTASYGGFWSLTGSPVTLYCDNLVVRDIANTLPTGKIKGLNISYAYSLGQVNWGDFWTQFVWTGAGGIKTQIDLAKSAGCNCIRAGSGGEAVWTGRISTSTFLSRLSQVVSYCQSQGLWYTHTEDENGPYFASSDPNQQVDLFNGIISFIVQIASLLANHRNALSIDIMNEYNLFTTIAMYNFSPVQSGLFTMNPALWEDYFSRAIPAIRAVAPLLPLSSSVMGLFNDVAFSAHAYQFDHIDMHVYVTPGASDSQAIYSQLGTSGKKLFLSEFGDAMSDGDVNRVARMNAVWNNVVTTTYSGQPGCIGATWWATVPQDTPGGANDWGLWDNANPAVARVNAEPTFAGFSSQATSFPPTSNFRRRRR